MKKIMWKAFGLFIAVFSVSQVFQADSVHAATPEMSGQKKSFIPTPIHGGGCGCASCCVVSVRTNLPD